MPMFSWWLNRDGSVADGSAIADDTTPQPRDIVVYAFNAGVDEFGETKVIVCCYDECGSVICA